MPKTIEQSLEIFQSLHYREFWNVWDACFSLESLGRRVEGIAYSTDFPVGCVLNWKDLFVNGSTFLSALFWMKIGVW